MTAPLSEIYALMKGGQTSKVATFDARPGLSAGTYEFGDLIPKGWAIVSTVVVLKAFSGSGSLGVGIGADNSITSGSSIPATSYAVLAELGSGIKSIASEDGKISAHVTGGSVASGILVVLYNIVPYPA
jgi:hypothetical protein